MIPAGDSTTDPNAAEHPVAPGARSALILLLSINLFNYIDRYVLSAVEPLIRKEFFSPEDKHASTLIGLLGTAFMVSYMCAAPIFGYLADRKPRWLLMGIGVLVWSFASGGSGLAMAFWVLLVMRIFVGIGEAAYGPAAPTLISDLYPASRRGSVLAWFYMAQPIGTALGYLLGGLVSKHFSWHWAFLITLPPGILLAILCFLRKDPPRGGVETRNAAPKRAASLRDYRTLLATPSYLLAVGGFTLWTFAIGAIAFWSPRYLFEFRNAGTLETVNSNFGAITVVAGLGGTLAGGFLADRLRPRVRGAYFLVPAFGTLLACPIFIASMQASFPTAYYLMFAAMFCLFLSTGPINTIFANVTHPAVRASGYALAIFTIHALGDAISPPLVGLVNDATKSAEHPNGNMSFAFLILAGFMAASGIVWIVGSRFLDRDTELAPTRVP